MNKKIGMGTAAGVLIIVAAFIVMFAASYKQTRDQNENAGNSTPVTVNIPKDSKSKPISVTDETAGWKTYKNDEFGFEIKYPDDWMLASCEGNCQGFGPQNKDAIVEARVIDRPIDKAKLWLPALGMGNGITGEENVTINGLPALRLTITQDAPPSNDKFIEMLMGNNGKTYDVGIRTDSPNLMAIYNKMLSTFKFTDQTSSVDTSDWKTYKNTDYNYEFSYPKEFSTKGDGNFVSINGSGTYDYIANVTYWTPAKLREECSKRIGKEDLMGFCMGMNQKEADKALDLVQAFFRDIKDRNITNDEIIETLSDEDDNELKRNFFGILTYNAAQGFDIVNRISVNGVNGVEIYGWASQDVDLAMFKYTAILVQGENALVYTYNPIRRDDGVYKKYIGEFLKDYKGFSENLVKKIESRSLEKDIQERYDVGKQIISTFKFD